MSDPDESSPVPEMHAGAESNAGKWILIILAVVYVAGSLYFLFNLRGRIDQADKNQAASKAEIAELAKRMQSAEASDELWPTRWA